MRILLFTGKGGVGKTTVAAATASCIAASGSRTLVLSTDPAHSLADAFDVALGDAPTPIAPNLWGQQLNARIRFEETWEDIREYMVGVLDWAGADAVEAEELAVVPGLDEVFALADIKSFATSDDFDVVVVDCAPTAETIRLLSLPDVLAWYMDRVFETQRRVTKLARPVLDRLTSLPIAGDRVFVAIRRFYDRLEGVRDLLTDGDITSARLVVNPERMVIAEARRTFTYLSLFGYHVDAVIANRMLPEAIDDPWFARWKKTQSAHLEHIEDAFRPLPVLAAELAGHELAGHCDLTAFGTALYREHDPATRLAVIEPMRIEAVGTSLVLSVHLPFTEREDVDLGRNDHELFLTIGPHRRAYVLPDSLLRREVTGARLAGDRLEVEFA
jgi:arsenite/tail-anchored protein-transporting ATPase